MEWEKMSAPRRSECTMNSRFHGASSISRWKIGDARSMRKSNVTTVTWSDILPPKMSLPTTSKSEMRPQTSLGFSSLSDFKAKTLPLVRPDPNVTSPCQFVVCA